MGKIIKNSKKLFSKIRFSNSQSTNLTKIQQKMYETIIIWAGASGLFCATQLPQKTSKLIIEKTDKIWTKLLLSGWGRCNFSNSNINPDLDYFWQNKKILPSLFHQFSTSNMLDFLSENQIEFQDENWKFFLKSGKSKELNELLINKTKENNTEILTNIEITKIQKDKETFLITTKQGKFQCKNLIIATWWKSFPQIWASDFAIQIAKQFGLKTNETLPGLIWLETEENVANLTGNSFQTSAQLLHHNKVIYQQQGPVLFTHRWVSWPTIFDISNALAEYKIKKSDLNNFDNFAISLEINNSVIKKISEHFQHQDKATLKIKNFRPRTEAKVMSWWVDCSEINPNMESKKVAWLYFLGEALDITGKTGGYNLQRCWTSAFACAKSFE